MGNKSILVIEDNELNMKLVRGLIKIGKYRMLEAIDAEKMQAVPDKDNPSTS